MPKTVSFQDRHVSQILERQLRNWELARELRRPRPGEVQPEVQPFVTISRMLGAGGIELGKLLSKKLGWPFFDRELLLAMARGDEEAVRLYDSVDERDQGWFEMIFSRLMDIQLSKDDYFQRLKKVVVRIARDRSSVFVGRGADLILPRDIGLRVHLVASVESCTRSYMAREHVSLEEARETVERVNAERAYWVRRNFHHDPEDPLRHDLCFNTDRIRLEEAAEMIVGLIRARSLTPE